MQKMDDELTGKIIGIAIDVHRNLGPGLLEKVYNTCLAYEFEAAGISFEREKRIPIEYKGLKFDCAYSKLGLLINFNSRLLKEGIRRFIL